jgi:nicotinate phosphoribosyltransferase
MVAAALADGTADRRCTFEVFARRLPEGRRYGVVAGTGRLLEAITRFRFGEAELERLSGCLGAPMLEWLADYRFSGDIDGYPEGELFFPGSPIVSVSGTFADAVVLETLVLSVFNHDCAVAAAAARMVTAAAGRPLIEMGSRRTHEEAAVARPARRTWPGSPRRRTSRRAGATASRPRAPPRTPTCCCTTTSWRLPRAGRLPGTKTTLLVDTYDIRTGIENAVAAAGPELGAIRIDSGDLGVLARQARDQLDELGATGTRIVLSGDLDEYAIAALRAEPVDSYGVGTSVVTGSGAPTASLVYKLVEVDGRPGRQAQRVEGVAGRGEVGGAPVQADRHGGRGGRAPPDDPARARPVRPVVPVPLVRGGEPVEGLPSLEESREHLRRRWCRCRGRASSSRRASPAVPTVFEE